MAARNVTLSIKADNWTELTDSTVYSLRFNNLGNNFILVQGTAGAAEPTSVSGAIRYNPGTGERNVLLSDMFPGISGVNRLWAYSEWAAQVSVSHA